MHFSTKKFQLFHVTFISTNHTKKSYKFDTSLKGKKKKKPVNRTLKKNKSFIDQFFNVTNSPKVLDLIECLFFSKIFFLVCSFK